MQNFSLLPLYFSRNPILSFNEEYINLDRIDITSLVNDDFIQNLVFRNSKNLHTVLKNYENFDYFALISPPIHRVGSYDIQLESVDTQVEST